MIYLPDTNALSKYFQGRDPSLRHQMGAAFEDLRLSSIVLAELEYGASKSGVARHRQNVDQLVAQLPLLVFNAEDAAIYGRLRAHLEKRGQIIGPIDTLIAAQALRLGATVVTHNLAEFKRVPKLKVVDWQAA
ncbi:type II toxin-antitoxin system VapC family toxin [Actomonas aquatica]|uniref:Ribonuclease VapC n=1 Tax=Actomonas aquatica TaxID=2866162 RepID=A0ABZ1CEI8_9BACT|nr:type II toxin-antitoxin system VapC family toxin [Opitutus sp. WL0086]WRQ90051.1 type II toxin-antitoxin system VapC family toxin [Opitutus sp. WL0086]